MKIVGFYYKKYHSMAKILISIEIIRNFAH
jgi:hypothetical protein